MWEALLLVAQAAIFGILVCGVYEYIRLRRRLVNTVTRLRQNMDCDALIDQLLEEEKPSACTAEVSTGDHENSAVCHKRDRLAALAAGGKARQYLGRAITAEQIDSTPDDEIEKLYARYESRLGAAMTQTLGAAAVQLYATAAGAILPIPPENHPKLIADLEADPFISHALSTVACELYHRYGMYLAPLTAAVTTARYCSLERSHLRSIVDEDGRPGESDRADSSSAGDDT